MGSTKLSLGHVAGIPIKVSLAWALILPLFTASLEPLFAGLQADSGWPLAILTTLLLVFSTVLHELGHALLARRLGFGVRELSISLFGSNTDLEHEPERAEHEFLIALSGPAVSLSLTIACGLLALATASGWRSLFIAVAIINGLICSFNLLPGYPLDGGRMLRAIFWFLGDDLIHATRRASATGRIIGILLVAIGVVLGITANLMAGLFLALVGWSMQRAAINGFLALVVQQTLAKVRVSDLMSRTFRSVPPQLTLDLFVGQYLLGQSEQGFPVVQAEQLLGLITVRHLRRFQINEWRSVSVGDIMTPTGELPQLQPEDPADRALTLLNQRHVDQLPVTEGDNLLGMLRRRDLITYIQAEMLRRRQRQRR